MSNVDGVFSGPPSMEGSRLLDTLNPTDAKTCVFGANSKHGTGGMESKVSSAIGALQAGVATVICNGSGHHPILKVVDGKKIGTLFTNQASSLEMPIEQVAEKSECIVLLSFMQIPPL